jgi:hypothetical protein
MRELGIDAHGVVFETNIVQSFDGLHAIPLANKRQPHRALLGLLHFTYQVLRLVRQKRPDIIHWYYSGSASVLNGDLWLLKALGIPGVIEWVGADIRIPEVEFAENPYYAAAYDNGYEYRDVESLKYSQQRQQRFAKLGFAALIEPGMEQYLQRDIFPDFYSVQKRVVVSDFEPTYPDSNQRRPLVIHSPTAPVTKGTAAVLRAVEVLKPHFDFDFRLIQGVPRADALRIVQKADIVLDQFVLGDRGMASIEALAFGKPVVCYIKPSLVTKHPVEMPIVNANQDTLAEMLASLLQDGQRRHELGRLGRAYVEKYHDAYQVSKQLLTIYQDVLKRAENRQSEQTGRTS